MKKRMLALAMALVLCLGLVPGTARAAKAPAVQVSFTAQEAGAFMCAPQLDVKVAGDLAEKYGYTDSVTGGVSVLDVLVKAHEVVLGEEFSKETAATKLAVNETGFVTTMFGKVTSNTGFILNGMYPNDGTESEYGGYNGTTVVTQEVADGDWVDFFFYQDTYYTDMLTWFCKEDQVVDSLTVDPGAEVALTLKGYMYMGVSEFPDKAALHAAGEEVGSAQLAWVDMEDGTLEDIPDTVTDEMTGEVTVTMPAESGTYYLTAYMPAAEIEENWASPLILSLTKVLVTAPFTVPADATLFVGSKSAHFVPFGEISPTSHVDNGDGTATYFYPLENDSTYNFRVSGENYVTSGGSFQMAQGFEKTLTRAELMPAGKTSATVERDVTANDGYNVADIFLNINPQGYLSMTSGDTYQLVNLRNWEAVNSTTANYFIEPDFHYTVVDESGAPSDVVTVSDSGLVTGNKAGTAIVLVTYDAMQVESAAGGPFFGAIWPENTGVFVVSVDAPESGIQTGMTLNEGKNTDPTAGKQALDALDAELDVIYFTGEQGSYTFTPKTAGCAVAVANPTVGETMTFTGFVPVEGNADGSFAVPLVEGRNIVKLTKDGKSTYQVITAKEVTVSGVPAEAVPGQEISLAFDTLYHPVNKLAGVYNMYAAAVYTDVDGYAGKLVGGAPEQYKFASTPEAQRVDSVLVRGKDQWGFGLAYNKGEKLTIPADWKEDTFTLSGGAFVAYYYGDPFGNHRGITLTAGKAPNLNAAEKEGVLGKLPDIVIPVKVNKPAPAKPPVSDDISVKFTLLGDKQHNSDRDKEVHTLKGGNLESWLEKTVTAPKGSTAFDVIRKALTGAGIDYEEDGSESGYITAVNGLRAMDNGQRSGWMYTLNGKYPDKGVKEQAVKDGDELVLHYTDDYAREEMGFSGEETGKPSRPNGSTGTAGSEKPAETGTAEPEEPAETGTILEEIVQFSDVSAEHWASSAVSFVTRRGLFRGTGGGKFSPEAEMSRGMVVTVLYRLRNGAVSERAGFFDVEEDAWYADGANWAYSVGVVTGDGAGFAPYRGVTRQELAVMMYRLVKDEVILEKAADLSTFSDESAVAGWAQDAMNWGVSVGLFRGKEGNRLDPGGVATRGEVAVLMERLVELMEQG